MDAPGVIPLRAGFDVEFRGYSRKQVLEHIDLLEDQLRMIAIDRDEATKLTTNCRQVCEELRTELDETRAKLARIESSTSGIPQAMQGMQNMLSIAEDEADTIRQRAERYAETVRGTANTDARQIRAEAEAAATALRAECEQLVVELEARRDRINVEHGKKIDALHVRAQDLRVLIQQEYEAALARARVDADAMLAASAETCAEAERESEQRRAGVEQALQARRAEAMTELEQNRNQLDEWRKQLIVMLCNSRSAIDASVATVTAHGAALQEQSEQWLHVDSPTATRKSPAHSTVNDEQPDDDSTHQQPSGNGHGPAIPRQQDGAQSAAEPADSSGPVGRRSRRSTMPSSRD